MVIVIRLLLEITQTKTFMNRSQVPRKVVFIRFSWKKYLLLYKVWLKPKDVFLFWRGKTSLQGKKDQNYLHTKFFFEEIPHFIGQIQACGWFCYATCHTRTSFGKFCPKNGAWIFACLKCWIWNLLRSIPPCNVKDTMEHITSSELLQVESKLQL